MKICISCGMPMRSKTDYFSNDDSKNYCIYCSKSDGTMLSYEEKFESLINLFIRTQGIDRTVAKDIAKLQMSKLPAWTK